MSPDVLDRSADPAARADHPGTERVVRGLSARRRRHALLVIVGLGATLLAVMAARVLLGRYMVTIPDFISILGGATIPGATFVVMEDKLPRAVLGALAGLAFGASGALFRRVLGNPLASPDILGISHGASAGAVAGMTLWGLRGVGVVPAALLGSAAALAVVLAASAGRHTGIVGQRFLLGGVAVAALGTAVVTQLIARVPLNGAREAAVWTVGSLSGASGERIVWLAVALVVLLPPGMWLHAALRPAELGPELAVGLGSRPIPTRAAALGVGSLLAAVATAVAGPLAFVALLSTPVAAALGRGRPHIGAAALTGAVIVVAADIVASEALGTVDLPTGVVTGALGAPAMLWILLRSRKVA
ncbi:iron chelate uptake ABC transporter family permease subunit [Dietzia sp. B32]|uniref:FecCD family ABC transporter permease n=1 Tax=Dietzia sp. B32 TaxID=2915130 RepID=UPI0021AE2606|nr:iron ABC transporter permease [Dietzia sp. B32]UVE95084.1 iron ABC transporter permease [Dietzia sp. B32]